MNEIDQEKRDKKYNEWARRNPAIVSMVFPLLVSVYFFQKYTNELSSVRYIVEVVISFGAIIPALLFFFQSSIREISVFLIETPLYCIFGRPSVNLMKKKSTILSDERKNRIFRKGEAEGISINYADGVNWKGRKHNRKLVKEAFEAIRENSRENSIVFEFNCTYGFFRNLCGGLIVDLLICLPLCIINNKHQLGIETMINVSVIILGSLLLFSMLCAYHAQYRFAERVYSLYDTEK